MTTKMNNLSPPVALGFIAAAASLLLASCGIAQADGQSATTVASPVAASTIVYLTPVVGSGTTDAGSQTAQYDFGKIDQGAAIPIKHVFILKNDNGAAVVVDRVQPSCGCTTAVAGGGAALPVTVAPGHTLEVDASIDPLRLFPGGVEKSIAVNLQGQAVPAATLMMTGTLQPAVSFSPDQLNFGDVAYGDEPALELTATVDTHMVSSLAAIQFNSSDPDITATRGATTMSANVATVVYTVKVSAKSYLGLLDASVSLMAPNSTGGMSMIGTTVPVLGNVVGCVVASPQSVSFANVPAGQPATQHLLLTGITAKDLPNVSVFSASPLIVAQLEPPAGGKGGVSKVVRLDISLTNKMAVGTLQTQVIVTAPDGERLMLPVFVYAVAPS